MPSPHETVAAAVAAAVAARYAAQGDPVVTREQDLPEVCPPAGLINVRFADPVEDGRAYGAGAREYSRVCSVEIAVQAASAADRISKFDALAVKLGALHGGGIAGVDWADVGAPTEVETTPVDGAETIRSGIVEITAFYRTADNPMEA